MPKNIHNIKTFLTGIVSSPDAKDIPEDAAESSLNIDPVSSDGRLQSIGGDEQIIETSPSSNFGQPDVADFVNIDGKRLLVGANIKKNQILTLDNFHDVEGATQFNVQNVNNVLNPSIVVHNNESYIGLGAKGADKPKFVGKVLNKNILGLSTSDIIIEDAENKAIELSYFKINKLATTIPANSDFGNTKSEEIKYIWGVGDGNNFLFKVTVDQNATEGTVEVSNIIQDSNGLNILTNIVSIATCISQENMLWATGEDGNIYRLHVNASTNDITIESIISPQFLKENVDHEFNKRNKAIPENAILSDIIEARGSQSGDQLNHQLVISYYKEDGFNPGESYMYSRTLTPWDTTDIVNDSIDDSIENINTLNLDTNNNIVTRTFATNFLFRDISTIFNEYFTKTIQSNIVNGTIVSNLIDKEIALVKDLNDLKDIASESFVSEGQPIFNSYETYEYNTSVNYDLVKETLNLFFDDVSGTIDLGRNLGFEEGFKLHVAKFGLIATNESETNSNDVYVHLYCNVDKNFCNKGGTLIKETSQTGGEFEFDIELFSFFDVTEEMTTTNFSNGFFISTKANKDKNPYYSTHSHTSNQTLNNSAISCVPYESNSGYDVETLGDTVLCRVKSTGLGGLGTLDLANEPFESMAIDRFGDRNSLAISGNTYTYVEPGDNDNLCFIAQSTFATSPETLDGTALHVIDFDSVDIPSGGTDYFDDNAQVFSKSGIDTLFRGKSADTPTYITSKETLDLGGSALFPIFNTATGNGGAGSNVYRIWQFALHSAGVSNYRNGIQDTAESNTHFNNFSGNFTEKLTAYSSFIFTEVAGQGSNSFETDEKLFYKVAIVFDNGSVSKLSFTEFEKVVSANIDALKIQIFINKNDVSPRAVGLQLYRRRGALETQYHLAINDISLLSGWSEVSGTNYLEKTVFDNGEEIGLYQDISGLSLNSVTKETLPNYGISTIINNKHIIGHCFTNQLGSMPNRLFASLTGRYNSFKLDDELNSLLLPSKPTAIKGFNGRLFAFEENKMFIINTDAMIIEDQLEGIGCLSQESVVVTEFGMFTANNSNIYHYTGENTIPIASSILKSNNNIGWLERDPTFDPLVAFNSKRDSLIVLFKQPILLSDEEIQQYILDNPTLDITDIITNLTNWFCWVYNLRLKRWDLWEVPPSVEPLSIVADKNGDIVMATSGGLFKYATDEDNKRKWEWVSKQITLGEDNKSKKYYKVKTHSNTDEEFLQYSIDKGEFIEGLNINKKAKSLQIKIDSEDPNLEVDSISIPYRNLPNSKQNL